MCPVSKTPWDLPPLLSTLSKFHPSWCIKLLFQASHLRAPCLAHKISLPCANNINTWCANLAFLSFYLFIFLNPLHLPREERSDIHSSDSPSHHRERGGSLLQEPNQADFSEIFPWANPLLVWWHHVIWDCRLFQHVGRNVLKKKHADQHTSLHSSAYFMHPVPSIPGRSHSLRAGTCGPPACSGILPPEQRCAPDTAQPRRGCSSPSVFRPCSGATSAAGLVTSGNPSQSWTHTYRHTREQDHDRNSSGTHLWWNKRRSLVCACILHLYMRSISISGSSWCSFILTVSDRIMCRLNTRSWTWKDKKWRPWETASPIVHLTRHQGDAEDQSIQTKE